MSRPPTEPVRHEDRAHQESVIPAQETLALGDRQEAWDRLTQIVQAFVAAWSGPSPPRVANHLPQEPAGLRHLALHELIKVDLRQCWQRRQQKWIEDYLAELPELVAQGDLPCDVIFEEIQARQQAGEQIEIDDYAKRFPRQADSLRRMVREAHRTITTSLVPERRPDEFSAGQRVDDFDLLTLLGKGAFAAVFLARQVSMQRLVALKVSADRGQEPQTLAQLDHPHIVRVYDQRSLPDKPFRLLYMQYLSGGTLQEVVQRVRQTPPAHRTGTLLLEAIDLTLSNRGESPPVESSLRRFLAEATWPEAVCWLGARLAEALDYAHRQGVLHRDLKPANVLLSSEGSPKLADFNVSYCSKVEGATAAAYIGGSLAYMSPEQMEACDPANERLGSDLDGRSDLFSLAVTLWELLTGRRPFSDVSTPGDWSETLRSNAAIRRAGVPTEIQRQLPPDCPAGFRDALLECLQSDRASRPATAGQAARQFQLCLESRVQSLLRPRGRSWLARIHEHPLVAICVAGLIPNMICAALNIFYNFREIISQLEAAQALPVFYRQMAAINPLSFSAGIFLALRYAWPLLNAVRKPDELDLSQCYELQRRTSRLGDVVGRVSGALWAVSGVVFPLWLYWEVGESAGLTWEHYLHFFMSQLLCGLLASTQSFFLVTTLAVHGLFPMLIRPDQESSQPIEWLSSLLERARSMFYLAVSVPFLAIPAIVLAGVEEGMPFIVLAGLGFVSFVVSFKLFGLVEEDVETLIVAVSPTSEGGTGSSRSRSYRRSR